MPRRQHRRQRDLHKQAHSQLLELLKIEMCLAVAGEGGRDDLRDNSEAPVCENLLQTSRITSLSKHQNVTHYSCRESLTSVS